MSRKIEKDWLSHPIINAIFKIGSWGLYAVIVVIFLIGILEIVDARNERVWQITLALGKIAAAAWILSWVVFIVVGVANWFVNMFKK